ncbi:hypothetical protein ACQ86N_30755 [Puia sp. P3]
MGTEVLIAKKIVWSLAQPFERRQPSKVVGSSWRIRGLGCPVVDAFLGGR